jgi:hypothetical protein
MHFKNDDTKALASLFVLDLFQKTKIYYILRSYLLIGILVWKVQLEEMQLNLYTFLIMSNILLEFLSFQMPFQLSK